MELITGGIASGKTSNLVKKASNYNGFIVCANASSKEMYMHTAKQLGCLIKEPLSIHDLKSFNELSTKFNINKLHFDDIDMCLSRLFPGVIIDTITCRTDEEGSVSTKI